MGVGEGVLVGVGEGVLVGVGEGVLVGVGEGVLVGVGEGVLVGVGEGVLVGVSEGVAVGAAVGVGVGVAVGTAAGVGVGVAVRTAAGVGVGAAVAVGVGVAMEMVARVSVGTTVDAGLSLQAFRRIVMARIDRRATRRLIRIDSSVRINRKVSLRLTWPPNPCTIRYVSPTSAGVPERTSTRRLLVFSVWVAWGVPQRHAQLRQEISLGHSELRYLARQHDPIQLELDPFGRASTWIALEVAPN